MRWKRIEDVPERLRSIGGASLNVEQAELIARWAEEYEGDPDVRNAWGMAVVKFKRAHRISGGEWTRRVGDSREESLKRVAVKFSKKHFRNAAEAEEWLEGNTEYTINSERGVEDMGDAYYYMTEGKDATGGRCVESGAGGLGVTYLYKADDRSGGRREDSGEPETFDVENVEIFRAGDWTDSAGRRTSYSVSDLENMARAHSEMEGRFEAPVKLGHDNEQPLLQADGMPAAGWLANLRVAGSSLYADLKSVPKKVYEIMKANGFKKRSLEVIHNFKDEAGGAVHKHVASGLALLGAQLPAIGSLSDVRALYCGIGGETYMYESGEAGIALADEESVDENGDGAEEAFSIEDLLKEMREAVGRLEQKVSELAEARAEDAEEIEDEDLDEESGGEEADAASDPEEAESENEVEVETENDRRMRELEEELAKLRENERTAKYTRSRDFLKSRLAGIPPAYHEAVERIHERLCRGESSESRYGMESGGPDCARDFELLIESLGEHDALREYGRRRMEPTGADLENEERIEKYCLENGLDSSRAGDYAKAVMAVRAYETPAGEEVAI